MRVCGYISPGNDPWTMEVRGMGPLDALKKLYKRAETAAESTAAAGSAAAKAAGDAVTAGVATIQEKVITSRLLGDTGDKLSVLLEKLRSANLDDKVKSWISKDKNQAVTPEQVKVALGDAEVKAVASEMGVTSDQAAGTIAKLLPTIIDKLTPDGLVPDPEALARKITGFLKK
jgi:uncharacterized protein YidB (DUF937 family)